MDTLSFFKRGDFKVSFLKFCKSLGGKVHLFNSLGTTKISRSLRISIYINIVLLINFPEQFNLNYSFTSNIREVVKFYNLGDKTFETDFIRKVWLAIIGAVFFKLS